jgi:alpha-mannosidase
MVYEDADRLYAEVAKDAKALLKEAFHVLFPSSEDLTSSNVKSLALNQVVAYNTTFFPRRDIVQLPVASSQLKSQVVQTSRDGSIGYALIDCEGGASLGFVDPAANEKSLSRVPMPVSGAFSSLFFVTESRLTLSECS